MRWILVLLISILPTAMADEEAHFIAFTEGRYLDAVELAETDPDPDRHAFAARSLLAKAMSAEDQDPPLDLVEQAEQYARAALLEAPQHIEGRLQLAIALSLKARPLTTREAMKTGYGELSKDLALAVIEDDPENPYAHGFMAVWHIEVRRRGGSFGATFLGASVRRGREHYQKAIASKPEDASIHWQYARALAALNAKKYRSEIEAALQAANDCDTASDLETVMKARAQTLSDALATEPRKTVEALATRML